MRFIYNATDEVVTARLSGVISEQLQAGHAVLWLVSGGSAVAIAVSTAKRLPAAFLANLTVMQVDERYGPVGHADSNWRALQAAGFNAGAARCIPMLRGLSCKDTIAAYRADLSAAFGQRPCTVGLFGIGTDGHTAGMLPGSTAAQETAELVAGFVGPDFQRITITAPAIAQLDFALAYAMGTAKAPTLQQLRGEQTIAVQPAQALKRAANLEVYTDNNEGDAA